MYLPQQLLEMYEAAFATTNFNTNPTNLYKPVEHIMAMKGKKIRPLLVLMGCDLFGGEVKAALNPAFAVEVFHNFTLVHDDIMDQADIRRGEPTVHKKYGVNAAILAGDVMLAYAYKYLTNVELAKVPAVLDTFNETAIAIFEGQQMDVDFEKREDVTLPEYLKMIEYKTSVLLACCLKLGAIVAGAGKEDQQHLYDFGLNLGLAFQIKDDLLDAFGEGDKVGKKIGGDILMNKKTYLMISCLQKADAGQKETLKQLFTEVNEESKIQQVKELMLQTGSKQATEQKAEELYGLALESLRKVNLPEERKKMLYGVAQKIHEREF